LTAVKYWQKRGGFRPYSKKRGSFKGTENKQEKVTEKGAGPMGPAVGGEGELHCGVWPVLGCDWGKRLGNLSRRAGRFSEERPAREVELGGAGRRPCSWQKKKKPPTVQGHDRGARGSCSIVNAGKKTL